MSSNSEKIAVSEITNSAGLSPQQIAEFNARYRQMNFRERLTEIYKDFDPAKILVTSSFAATMTLPPNGSPTVKLAAASAAIFAASS